MGATVGREILMVAEIGEADRQAEASGTSTLVLMERAGEAVAQAVGERFPDGPVLVLCGPGN
ncbi:MAG: bifunctional ADP-dependent NAD(P)H-hydrate dehydratase/NAD(P)H-hydrate epimerase, partial [Caulobacteraceae bacterium]